jgi:DNA polymerase-3 subunit delta
MVPVHLVAGDDELLVQRVLERLLAQLRRDDPELEVETHEATEIDGLPEMRTASLFGGRLCVVIRDVRTVTGSLKTEIEDYLAAPDPDAVLVLTAVAADHGKSPTGQNRKIARLAKQHGQVHEVAVPRDYQTSAWEQIVRGEFERLGREAGPEVVAAILEHAGLSPAAIASRVAQVAEGVAAGTTITVDDVERHVQGHGHQSNFAVVDAVADRDPAAALTLLRGFLDAGKEPLLLVGAMVYRFRQLSQVRGGLDHRAAGMAQGQWRRLKTIASHNFTVGELGWCTDRLARLDVDLKGNSPLPPELVLELAVIDLATRREVGAPWNPLAS